jgi:hypothetical protein
MSRVTARALRRVAERVNVADQSQIQENCSQYSARGGDQIRSALAAGDRNADRNDRYNCDA